MSKEINNSSVPKKDLLELVWENGQISVQDHIRKGYDKDSGQHANEDNGLNDIRTRFVSSSHDEDLMMMPWLNYAMDEHSLQHEFNSSFLHELSGVNTNDFAASNEFSLLDRSNCVQVFSDSHKQGNLSKGYSSVAAEEFDTSELKTSTNQLYTPTLLHQCQASPENNTKTNANQHATCKGISHIPSSSTIMNFTHFAKPVATVKANLQNIGLSSSRSESVGVKNKDEAVIVDLSGECSKKSVIHCHQAVESSRVDLKHLEQDAAVSAPACKEHASKIYQTSNQIFAESGKNGPEAVEKYMAPGEVSSSSVSSDNGAYRGSDDPNQNLKGKNICSEDSESHSEDIDDESVGIKRTAHRQGGFGLKRNRSSEVHNLSERRRRDKINEKMRTLQELIPNCNKADKASMLDEAIEYLKTLQLQLQIMSMNSGGLYMPMMLPAGMQQMHMSPFSPMSVAMQMGLGVPHFQGTHLPVAHASGLSALHGMAARPNPQMFWFPGQGIQMPMPCAPMFSYPRESVMNSSAVGLNASGTAGLMETVELASAPKLKDPLSNMNSQVMQNINGCNSSNPISIQCEATIGEAEQSILVLDSGHVSSTNDKAAFTLGNEDNPVIDKSHA